MVANHTKPMMNSVMKKEPSVTDNFQHSNSKYNSTSNYQLVVVLTDPSLPSKSDKPLWLEPSILDKSALNESRLISGNFPVSFASLSLEEILDVPTLVFGLCETQTFCACDVDALWTLRDASDDVFTVKSERCLFRPLLRSSFLSESGLTCNGRCSFPLISLYFTLASFLLLIMFCAFIELSDLTCTLCLPEPKVVSFSLFNPSVLHSFEKSSKHFK